MSYRSTRNSQPRPHKLPSRRSPLPPTHRCSNDPPPNLTPAELLLAMDCDSCFQTWAQQLADDVEYHDPLSAPEGDYEELVAALWATQGHQDRLYLQQALPGLDLPQWPRVPVDDDT